jgi:hypothetical protein
VDDKEIKEREARRMVVAKGVCEKKQLVSRISISAYLSLTLSRDEKRR